MPVEISMFERTDAGVLCVTDSVKEGRERQRLLCVV